MYIIWQHLPSFGPFLKEREQKIAQFKHKDDLLAEDYQPQPQRPPNAPKNPVPAIRAIIGAAVDRIGTYNDLDNKQQVVALIDEVYLLIYFWLKWSNALLFPRKCVSTVASATWHAMIPDIRQLCLIQLHICQKWTRIALAVLCASLFAPSLIASRKSKTVSKLRHYCKSTVI